MFTFTQNLFGIAKSRAGTRTESSTPNSRINQVTILSFPGLSGVETAKNELAFITLLKKFASFFEILIGQFTGNKRFKFVLTFDNVTLVELMVKF